MKSGWQIAFSREGIQEGLCKLHQPVHVCEVRGKAARNAHSATALHTQRAEKLIPAHPCSPLQYLPGRAFPLISEGFAHRLLPQIEPRFPSATEPRPTLP